MIGVTLLVIGVVVTVGLLRKGDDRMVTLADGSQVECPVPNAGRRTLASGCVSVLVRRTRGGARVSIRYSGRCRLSPASWRAACRGR